METQEFLFIVYRLSLALVLVIVYSHATPSPSLDSAILPTSSPLHLHSRLPCLLSRSASITSVFLHRSNLHIFPPHHIHVPLHAHLCLLPCMLNPRSPGSLILVAISNSVSAAVFPALLSLPNVLHAPYTRQLTTHHEPTNPSAVVYDSFRSLRSRMRLSPHPYRLIRLDTDRAAGPSSRAPFRCSR